MSPFLFFSQSQRLHGRAELGAGVGRVFDGEMDGFGFGGLLGGIEISESFGGGSLLCQLGVDVGELGAQLEGGFDGC